MVGAGRRHFQRPLHVLLAHHIGKIRPLGRGAHILIGLGLGQLPLPPQKLHQLPHMAAGHHLEPVGHRRLGPVARGQEDPAGPLVLGRQRHGQHACAGPQCAIQAQLAQKAIGGLGGRDLPRSRQNAQQDGQVVHRPLFFQIGRGQVYRDAAQREIETAVAGRRPHPVPGFFHRSVGQPHDLKGGQPVGQIALTQHRHALNAPQPCGQHFCHHTIHPFSPLVGSCLSLFP